jgi:hypothetical protein
MNKKILLLILSLCIVLMLSSLASAYIVRNITQEGQEEWQRYEEYRADYIESNNLEAFSKYVDERNLMRNFGFKPASYYYLPPAVLAAKYNPPLQGDVYETPTRGVDTSLNHPSAIKYYGEKINGKYTGYIPADVDGVYFDHPDMNGATGYLTVNPSYGNGYGYNSYASYSPYGYDRYNNYGQYNTHYDNNLPGDFESARYYARVAEPLSDNYYVVGFY